MREREKHREAADPGTLGLSPKCSDEAGGVHARPVPAAGRPFPARRTALLQRLPGRPRERQGESVRGNRRFPVASSSEGPRVLGMEGAAFSHSQEDYGHLVDSDP